MSGGEFRLPSGGRIDRSRPLRFSFGGRQYQGYEGDTLASALLANGVRLTARSFKYHRPRGIMGAGYEEPSSFVELAGEDESGNQAITTVRLRDGLRASPVNCWPSPGLDLMAANQLFARMLPAAFYYKTFMWPDWHLFEPHIRRAAGLAAAPQAERRNTRYETRHWHCDVLVAGAGPAGLMAALVAARSGARVLLADEGLEAGGSLLGRKVTVDGRPALDWVAAATAELDGMDNVTRLRDATVWAYREGNLLLVTERSPDAPHVFQRTWRVRAGRVVIATGAIERAMVFADNDRPGMMLASAVQTYVNRYAVRPGRRAVIFTNNTGAYAAAADMLAAGIDIAAIVDSRLQVEDDARALVPGVEILAGHVVQRSHGGRRVTGVTVQPKAGGTPRRLRCDLVCMSGGWSPTVHLFSQSRGRLRYEESVAAFVPAEPAQPAACAGAAEGRFELAAALTDGAEKGRLAAAAMGFRAQAAAVPQTKDAPRYAIEPLWHVEQHKPTAKSFVDVQNDVTLNDIHLAMREGFGAVEHVKRYTTAGMGIDQGKTGNINIIGAIAGKEGVPLEEVGTTTFRSPYVPIEFGALAGARRESVVLPYRHTPMTAWHIEAGAVMYEAGARWRRPGYYPRAGESFQETVNREARTVRTGAAVYDGSPLGKFEIKGRDALRLIEMLYTNAFSSLKTGMGRYGLMLSDDGLVLDDGVTFKLGDGHYLMSTSTGNADEVNRHMTQFCQVERPEWDVHITPVTAAWSNATVCGPRAREVMEALGTDIDLSPDAFPFMAIREGTVAGMQARLCRVSFTGELSFEINVRSRDAAALWRRVLEVGAPFGLIPIGSEANHVLRVEKGFLSLGHEVDATVDPYDLGIGWAMSKKKPDYIGKRAVEIRRKRGGPRRELVGLLIDEPERLVTEGAPITPGGRKEASEGFVSACVWSVVHNRSVALALLKDGRARMGQKAHIRMKDEVVTALITRPCFHDPDGNFLRS
ncbi:sarcosine oxidase subunit alpha family protein [Marinimicrococcus flavescens]|uniref:Sarcosine oxidase subunit alpha family protein n=1 Tax=Marinimicrococcus flavescens TaxID=3031815 RepID=A0AAP3XR62_9PROT|nr:sarcosine oxidase subunit alpha family protein [Marinimicrococcus flavescens]